LKPSIIDSHELVEYWMVRMNKEVGTRMKNKETGIFRKAIYKNETNELHTDIDDNTSRLIRSWNNTDCKYVIYDKDMILRHDMMDIDEYVHITSPIRRIVDLLNQIMLLSKEQLVGQMSESAETFLQKWVEKIHQLNIDMKAIRKVQTDCRLLEICSNDTTILDNIHNCVIFGKTEINGIYSYMVYLKDANILTHIKTPEEYNDLSKHKCKLYMFSDEDNIKNKIKCHLLE